MKNLWILSAFLTGFAISELLSPSFAFGLVAILSFILAAIAHFFQKKPNDEIGYLILAIISTILTVISK